MSVVKLLYCPAELLVVQTDSVSEALSQSLFLASAEVVVYVMGNLLKE